MFNNFHGFHLVEELHKRNLERAAKRLNSKFFKLLLAIAATLTIWLLPADSFGIANLTLAVGRQSLQYGSKESQHHGSCGGVADEHGEQACYHDETQHNET